MSRGETRREFLSQMAGLAALTAAGSIAEPAERSEPRRPSIVLVIADDLGYGDLGCYGCPDIRTPVIDKLASQGVRFTSFYANGPECTPTRAALMTGRYQQRIGGLECAIGTGNVGRYDDAIRLAEKHELGLPVDEKSIARMLKDAGYATGLCGKWHLGYEPKFSPLKHGFDHFFGVLGGTADYFHHTEPQGDPMLYLNDKPVQREGYLTDLITQEGVGFIKRHRIVGFFLDVSYTAPHSPYQRPGDKKDKPVPQADWDVGTREDYAAMTEHMDKGVGEILAALEEAGVADNTVVIFISDNGGTDKGRNAPFSGNKGGLFEGGIRVPCIVRWPGVMPAGAESNHLAITMDLTASIARIAGVSPPENRPFDGVDILRQIERERIPSERRLFWRARRGERTWRAVRKGSLKYITRKDGDKLDEFLFDLDLDPQEKTNLLSDRKPDAESLKHPLANWESEVQCQR